MSQPPNASQSYSNDGRTGDESRLSLASLEESRSIYSAPRMPVGRAESENVPRNQIHESTGAASRFRSILNPADTQVYPSPQQHSFVASPGRAQLSYVPAGYSHENWSRLNPARSAHSSPRLQNDSSNLSLAQEHRETSAPLPSQRISMTPGTPVRSLYHHASAPDLSQLAAQSGQLHQMPSNPNPQYHSYNPRGQTSPPPPPSIYWRSPLQEAAAVKLEPLVSRPGTQTLPPASYGSAITATSTALPNYRMMTLETEQGNIAVRVDVEGASRVADEKRKRNAGASARFRARRKEKEQANSKEIDDLKREIRELGEDADFYRQERDYLAAALLRTAERDRHFPRPPSPRQRRGPTRRRESSSSPIGGPSLRYESYEEQGERGGEGRHTRRRVSTDPQFTHQQPPLPPPPSASAQYPHPSYGQQTYGSATPSRPPAIGQLQSSYPQLPTGSPLIQQQRQQQPQQPPQRSPRSTIYPSPSEEHGKPP